MQVRMSGLGDFDNFIKTPRETRFDLGLRSGCIYGGALKSCNSAWTFKMSSMASGTLTVTRIFLAFLNKYWSWLLLKPFDMTGSGNKSYCRFNLNHLNGRLCTIPSRFVALTMTISEYTYSAIEIKTYLIDSFWSSSLNRLKRYPSYTFPVESENVGLVKVAVRDQLNRLDFPVIKLGWRDVWRIPYWSTVLAFYF